MDDKIFEFLWPAMPRHTNCGIQADGFRAAIFNKNHAFAISAKQKRPHQQGGPF